MQQKPLVANCSIDHVDIRGHARFEPLLFPLKVERRAGEESSRFKVSIPKVKSVASSQKIKAAVKAVRESTEKKK
jgi:hypothetical protein